MIITDSNDFRLLMIERNVESTTCADMKKACMCKAKDNPQKNQK